MLKEKYKTTLLYEPGEHPPLEIKVASRPPSFRFFQIIKLLIKALWRTRFGKANDHIKGVAWRSFFETMGGMWVKVGQVIAMRTDLFDKDFTRELSKLHYRVHSFPYDNVVQIVEASCKRKMDAVFSEFDQVPIAAASLAQVHKARLRHNGKLVAVKVQRPYAQEFLKMDMKIIRKLFNFFKKFEAFEAVLLDEMFWELETMLTEEIDFRYEVNNLKEAKKRFKKYGVYVPNVYKSLSSDKVVVMEFIQGVTMSEYIVANREDPARLRMWLSENKIKPKKVGGFLLRNTWRQVIEDNYFHGDLQPGNIMLLAKSRIAMIDLGSVGTTDEETLSFYRQQIIAIGKKNYLKAADFSMLTSPNIPSENHTNIRQSIVRGLRGALMKASLTDVDIEQKTTVHNASNEMAKELAKYKVSPNWSLLKLIRTFLTVDPSVVNLNPKINLEKEWIKYYKEARWRILKQRITSLIEVPANITDSLALLSKTQREQAIDYKARVSKGIVIAGYFLGLLKWVFNIAFVLLVLTFLYQHTGFIDHPSDSTGNWFTGLLSNLPYIPTGYWIGILIIALIFIRNYVGVLRVVKQPVKQI